MRLEHHVIISIAIGGLIYIIFKDIVISITSVIAGVFIDIDHFIDYVYHYGIRVRVTHFFKCFYNGYNRKVIVPLHSWELLMLLTCLYFFYNNTVLLGVIIGFSQHLVLDQLFNVRESKNKFKYFLYHRYKNKFDRSVFYLDYKPE